MIIITGPNRNDILQTLESDRLCGGNVLATPTKHKYTNAFLCEPAKISENQVVLNTYHEITDAKILRKKAELHDLNIQVEVA